MSRTVMIAIAAVIIIVLVIIFIPFGGTEEPVVEETAAIETEEPVVVEEPAVDEAAGLDLAEEAEDAAGVPAAEPGDDIVAADEVAEGDVPAGEEGMALTEEAAEPGVDETITAEGDAIVVEDGGTPEDATAGEVVITEGDAVLTDVDETEGAAAGAEGAAEADTAEGTAAADETAAEADAAAEAEPEAETEITATAEAEIAGDAAAETEPAAGAEAAGTDGAAEGIAGATSPEEIDPEAAQEVLTVDGFDLDSVTQIIEVSDIPSDQQETLISDLEAAEGDPEELDEVLTRVREALEAAAGG